jgi:uncharacterized membrane protein YheB (UPF0754 family)
MAVPELWTWISIPAIGGVIGYVTNWIAVKMIFRPIRPVSVLGIRVQGLVGKRQRELAQSIGRVVGGHLLSHEDVVEAFGKLDFDKILGQVLESGLAPKIAQLRALPLIGGFLTQERVEDIKRSLIQGVLDRREIVLNHLEDAVENGLDIAAVVERKVSEFSVETMERLILEVARRELRAIEILGGVLGVVIGIGQVLLLWALEK